MSISSKSWLNLRAFLISLVGGVAILLVGGLLYLGCAVESEVLGQLVLVLYCGLLVAGAGYSSVIRGILCAFVIIMMIIDMRLTKALGASNLLWYLMCACWIFLAQWWSWLKFQQLSVTTRPVNT